MVQVDHDGGPASPDFVTHVLDLLGLSLGEKLKKATSQLMSACSDFLVMVTAGDGVVDASVYKAMNDWHF